MVQTDSEKRKKLKCWRHIIISNIWNKMTHKTATAIFIYGFASFERLIYFFIKKLFKLKHIFFVCIRETGIRQHHSSKSIVQSIWLSNYFHFSPPFSLFSNFITIFVAFCIYCHIMDETRSTPKSKEKPLPIFLIYDEFFFA